MLSEPLNLIRGTADAQTLGILPESENDLQAIRNAIRDVLEEHIRHPFHTLREVGIQSDLRDALRRQLRPSFVALASPHPSEGRVAASWSSAHQTCRVALEMKITGPDISKSTSTDVVVLRAGDPVRLQWRGGGPGDAVAQIDAQHVAAAIEIKASPSTTAERRRYVRDVQRLSALQQNGSAGFFVVVDKSLALYGTPTNRRKSQSDWLKCPVVQCKLQLREVRLSAPENHNEPAVEIWDIASDDASWRPRCHLARARS